MQKISSIVRFLCITCLFVNCNQTPTGNSKAQNRITSVVATTVTKHDIPLYLYGLGNATAYYTVAIRSRVDGVIETIAFKEGQYVKKGDLLAQIDPLPYAIQLQNAQAALARDAAQLRNNKLNLERNKILRQKNLVPQQTVDDAQTATDQYEAIVLTDKAQIDTAKLQLTYARITSPIDGLTGVRAIDPGNLVHAADSNSSIVTITQIDPIAVLFTLPQDDLIRVNEQMALNTLPVEALSRDEKIHLGEGYATVVDNQINASTGTIRLKAVFQNPNKTLWPNQFLKIRMRLKILKDVLAVPVAAIQHGQQDNFVYVIDANNTVHMQPVELDTTTDEMAVIAKGLQEGQQVVLDGQFQLHPGSIVNIQSATIKQAAEHTP